MERVERRHDSAFKRYIGAGLVACEGLELLDSLESLYGLYLGPRLKASLSLSQCYMGMSRNIFLKQNFMYSSSIFSKLGSLDAVQRICLKVGDYRCVIYEWPSGAWENGRIDYSLSVQIFGPSVSFAALNESSHSAVENLHYAGLLFELERVCSLLLAPDSSSSTRYLISKI